MYCAVYNRPAARSRFTVWELPSGEMPVAVVWRCHWLHARQPGLGIGKKQPRPPQTKIITHLVPCYRLWSIFLTQIVVSTNCKHSHCFVVITRSLIHFLVVQLFRLLDRLGSALRLHGSVCTCKPRQPIIRAQHSARSIVARH